ncbi:unnamed protein product [Lymnaea stagnalis]|uniref:Uncharacterized protein n=1 Tax=Lymnaea stagnalis TaxID=6523 RepID=A0AAV2H423_LYMST
MEQANDIVFRDGAQRRVTDRPQNCNVLIELKIKLERFHEDIAESEEDLRPVNDTYLCRGCHDGSGSDTNTDLEVLPGILDVIGNRVESHYGSHQPRRSGEHVTESTHRNASYLTLDQLSISIMETGGGVAESGRGGATLRNNCNCTMRLGKILTRGKADFFRYKEYLESTVCLVDHDKSNVTETIGQLIRTVKTRLPGLSAVYEQHRNGHTSGNVRDSGVGNSVNSRVLSSEATSNPDI